MKVHYISCAKSSSVDSKTNQLSLFHVLDEISAASFPLHLTSFCIAALFERESEDADMQSFVLAITLDEALLASFTMAVDFTKSRRNRSVNTIQGLNIPGPGAIKISLLQKTRVLADWHALALQAGAPATQAPPASKPAVASEPKAAIPKGSVVLN